MCVCLSSLLSFPWQQVKSESLPETRKLQLGSRDKRRREAENANSFKTFFNLYPRKIIVVTSTYNKDITRFNSDNYISTLV